MWKILVPVSEILKLMTSPITMYDTDDSLGYAVLDIIKSTTIIVPVKQIYRAALNVNVGVWPFD